MVAGAVIGGRLAGGGNGRSFQGRGGAHDPGPGGGGFTGSLSYFPVSEISIEGHVEESSIVYYKM
jgi:hypothetical protein